MRGVVALSALAFAMGVVQAQADDASYSCSRGDTVRTVAVVTLPASGRACEVHYEKTSMGAAPEVLWHADSDMSFCADQAKALVERLGDAGWTCSASAGMSASADPMPEPMAAAVEVSKPMSDEAADLEALPAGVTAATGPKPIDPVFHLRPTIH